MNTKLLVLAGFLAVGIPAAVAADAKSNWAEHCAKCHGKSGQGDTKIGKHLRVNDYSDAKVQAELKDDEMVEATLKGVKVNGKQRMKGFGDELSPSDAKALVELIRSFKK